VRVMSNGVMSNAVTLRATAVRAVVEARHVLGWSQRKLAEQASTSPSFVSRFERNVRQAVTLEATERLFEALGNRAELRAELPVVDGDRRQVDAVHAWACGYVGRRLASLGWDVRHEVEVGSGRFRGWIDVMGYRALDRSLLTSEIKTDLPDVGGLQRTTGWYEREAWATARRLGWRPVRQVAAVLALDSSVVEARIRANHALIAASFPGRAAALATWLEQPGAAPPGRCLALIDPASRGRQWLRPSRADGRRSPSRYINYADAAERLRRARP
jgi:transcriptional regulator with XRE-family HTH domain